MTDDGGSKVATHHMWSLLAVKKGREFGAKECLLNLDLVLSSYEYLATKSLKCQPWVGRGKIRTVEIQYEYPVKVHLWVNLRMLEVWLSPILFIEIKKDLTQAAKSLIFLTGDVGLEPTASGSAKGMGVRPTQFTPLNIHVNFGTNHNQT